AAGALPQLMYPARRSGPVRSARLARGDGGALGGRPMGEAKLTPDRIHLYRDRQEIWNRGKQARNARRDRELNTIKLHLAPLPPRAPAGLFHAWQASILSEFPGRMEGDQASTLGGAHY